MRVERGILQDQRPRTFVRNQPFSGREEACYLLPDQFHQSATFYKWLSGGLVMQGGLLGNAIECDSDAVLEPSGAYLDRAGFTMDDVRRRPHTLQRIA